MSSDEELLAKLGAALHGEHREPPADRVDSLRAAAAAAAAWSAAVTPVATRPPNRKGRLAAVVAVAAATTVAFAAGGALLNRDQPVGEDLLASGVLEFESTLTTPGGDTTATATGIMTGIGRIVQVRTASLPILPKGAFYELWFVGPGDSPRSPNRISAGTFHPDEAGRSHIDLTAAVDPKRYPKLSVTAEPGDGNPLPTGPEVLGADIVLDG